MRTSNVLELSASRNCDRTIPATRATREFAFPTLVQFLHQNRSPRTIPANLDLLLYFL
jgi:hypothetical protein